MGFRPGRERVKEVKIVLEGVLRVCYKDSVTAKWRFDPAFTRHPVVNELEALMRKATG
jgi:hypothetical protein